MIISSFVATPNPAITFPIIADTAEYVIINKPAGVVVHQSEHHPVADTVVNSLLARYPALVNVGDDLLRPGIVQRLDQAVSGVMVVAKTQAMFVYLKQQFQLHTVTKHYQALVHGRFSRPAGEIHFSLARSKQKYTKMAARPDTSGKPALTSYTVLKQYQHYTLLDVEIVTGRTHQIRVHLNAIGHPLIGEMVYLPKHFKSRLQPGRIFLHASQLAFTTLTGELVSFTTPLPSELQRILDQLAPAVLTA